MKYTPRKDRQIHAWVLFGIAAMMVLTGCLAVVKVGKTDPSKGDLMVSYGSLGGVQKAVQGPIVVPGVCSAFIAPSMPVEPVMPVFTTTQLKTRDFMTEILAIHSEDLRIYAARVRELWVLAYDAYRQSCNTPPPIKTP